MQLFLQVVLLLSKIRCPEPGVPTQILPFKPDKFFIYRVQPNTDTPAEVDLIKHDTIVAGCWTEVHHHVNG